MCQQEEKLSHEIDILGVMQEEDKKRGNNAIKENEYFEVNSIIFLPSCTVHQTRALSTPSWDKA